MTIFAPTDNAFQNLPAGTLNGLSEEKKVKLVLYHVLPKFYSMDDLVTISNPVPTQAGSSRGSLGLNFTGRASQVNVSTGVVETQINNALRKDFPLAVYVVDKVLLFQEDAPAPEGLLPHPGRSPQLRRRAPLLRTVTGPPRPRMEVEGLWIWGWVWLEVLCCFAWLFCKVIFYWF
ncbi:putative FAS1 domain-containing protein [Helianthus anomalus]